MLSCVPDRPVRLEYLRRLLSTTCWSDSRSDKHKPVDRRRRRYVKVESEKGRHAMVIAHKNSEHYSERKREVHRRSPEERLVSESACVVSSRFDPIPERSNPSPSCGESANHRSLSSGRWFEIQSIGWSDSTISKKH